MRYFVNKILELIRYFWGWRLILVATSATFGVLAVTATSARGWYFLAAAIPALVVHGVSGARTAANHAAVSRLRTEIRSIEARPPAQSGAERASDEFDEHEQQRSYAGMPRPIEPQVTVVVTAFNEHRHIVDCLRSIQEQTWVDFECIVIDDASTDNTMDLAYDKFSADGRFQFISLRSNIGLSGARNLGAMLARGPWITFVDGDDFLFEAALEKRLATLAGEWDNHWVVGAYCNWVSVPESAPRTARGKQVPARQVVTWLDALHDAPFIASAPLIRTKVVRSLGGFRSVSAAEDADFWTKVLRHGYVFIPTHYTGIAYRQKKRSMFRDEVVAHATVTTDLYVANYEPRDIESFVPGSPFPFTEAAPAYITAAESYRRNLIAFTTAVAQNNNRAIEQLKPLLDTTERPYLRWVVNVDETVMKAAKRSESYESESVNSRAAVLAAKVRSRLGPHLHAEQPSGLDPKGGLPDCSDAEHGDIAEARWVHLADRKRVRITSETATTALAGSIVLMPSAAYHVKELGPLGEELRNRGHRVAIMVNDRRWPWTEPGLRGWDFPIYAFPAETGWTRSVAGIVALNDWGEDPHDVIVAANEHGVPTFAKVEGVQDFDDVDVHWTRNAYRTAAHILCQGTNDREALPRPVLTHIVGSSRLERIWAAPPRRLIDELAVVNLNFTYGVLEEARDMWVDTVIEAGRTAGIPLVFSLHPAEKTRPAGAEISIQPISHLLTKASVLISRFSTVPFEAMARGVPFVYHNPHDEKVPTFLTPDDAFEVSHSAEELAEALVATREYASNYRPKCERFFRNQIDIDPDRDSAIRAADVIAGVLSSR